MNEFLYSCSTHVGNVYECPLCCCIVVLRDMCWWEKLMQAVSGIRWRMPMCRYLKLIGLGLVLAKQSPCIALYCRQHAAYL